RVVYEPLAEQEDRLAPMRSGQALRRPLDGRERGLPQLLAVGLVRLRIRPDQVLAREAGSLVEIAAHGAPDGLRVVVDGDPQGLVFRHERGARVRVSALDTADDGQEVVAIRGQGA